MRQQLLDLYAVQQIDVGIRDIQKRLDDIPTHLKELESKLSVSSTELEKLLQQREEMLKEVKLLEANVHAENLKLRKWEARLNEIRNQREYLALSREIDGSKRANREAEERINEIKAQRKQTDQQIETLQDTVAETEVDAESERQRVEEEQKNTSEEVKREIIRRDALLGKIPGPLLRKYDNIRSKRMGIGLVPVVDGYCQGCNMKLPPQHYNILQRVKTIEQCPSCQRLIFWSRILDDENADNSDGSSK
ncbi:MAG: hypothetical protein JW841_18700 [Deltaproteobacteria bacterium]|nr:hypothetical protein [Deltaproteobacteria bacterium]